jgi:hypothetical protein
MDQTMAICSAGIRCLTLVTTAMVVFACAREHGSSACPSAAIAGPMIAAGAPPGAAYVTAQNAQQTCE